MKMEAYTAAWENDMMFACGDACALLPPGRAEMPRGIKSDGIPIRRPGFRLMLRLSGAARTFRQLPAFFPPTAETVGRKRRYLTALTIASNAFGSFIARSASTFRLRAIPLALSLPMNCE